MLFILSRLKSVIHKLTPSPLIPIPDSKQRKGQIACEVVARQGIANYKTKEQIDNEYELIRFYSFEL